MNERAQRVAVVGFGIAGAMVAKLLAVQGMHVTVFEAGSAQNQQGAGLLLQASALAVLAQADLLAPILQMGHPIEKIIARFVPSQRQFELHYPEHKTACGIQRTALLGTLRAAACHAGCDVHWQTPIERADSAKGFLWNTREKNRFGAFDLIIAADGAQSPMRAQCKDIRWRQRSYTSAAVVCLAELPNHDTAAVLTQEFRGNSHVSYWPVGASQLGAPHCTAIAVPIANTELASLDYDTWLQTLQKIAPHLSAKVQALSSAPTLLPYRYCEVQVNRCFQQRIVLLGDAAHAMSPQLGLGAGLALLDAWDLAQDVKRLPITLALPEFDQSRRAQTQRIQRISRVTTPLFQSHRPLFALLREPLFRMLAGRPRIQAMALDVLCASGFPPPPK